MSTTFANAARDDVASGGQYRELPDVASRPQVSAFTGISIPTLARWASEGDKGPRYRRAGGRILYLKADVIAWLEGLESGGGQK